MTSRIYIALPSFHTESLINLKSSFHRTFLLNILLFILKFFNTKHFYDQELLIIF